MIKYFYYNTDGKLAMIADEKLDTTLTELRKSVTETKLSEIKAGKETYIENNDFLIKPKKAEKTVVIQALKDNLTKSKSIDEIKTNLLDIINLIK